MTTMTSHKTTRPHKILILGDSGSGKTGCLASLANAGQRLVIEDYDNGLDILHAYVDPKFLGNIYYVTLTDKMKSSPHGAIPNGVPTAITRGLRLLDNWIVEDSKLGPASSWGLDTTLVVDSLTFMGEAAMRYIRVINGRPPGESAWQSDWGEAMRMQESMLELLYSDAIKCNVIVTAHVVTIGGDEKTGAGGQGYPSALGKKLPPKVPRYFNAVLLAKTLGAGRRVLRTVSTSDLELKTPNPKAVPKELPLDTGLADYYKLVGGEVVKFEASA